jgi:hypothetical protein
VIALMSMWAGLLVACTKPAAMLRWSASVMVSSRPGEAM